MSEHAILNTSHLPVKLRVEDYLLLDESGAFEDYRKTELIDGDVYYMNAQHRPHARVKTRLVIQIAKVLRRVAPDLEALVEGSVAMPPHNVPEPDIAITSEADGDGVMPLSSIRLIVEVSDATLSFDLGKKAAIYAANAVSEYWVVDVAKARIHQHWTPCDGVYSEQRVRIFAEGIVAETIEGLAIETASL